ncbi:ribosomal RNA processing protein 1 homolog B isoform X2 [Meles meles]|uniref:ribosomal RNA processing protein 1 homolog B isoform X2 n=1 Tax=Meles meles TaxID=9662 RepID=UPI001E6A0120|nr:ribosomal RNA processing protein 1 homolog B isoform X2 [Meles meles]
MAPAMQPAELQFAQRLASQEKGVRERAVRKLRQYLSVKTQRETEHLFLQTFWQTMNREWTGIDRLRLDKFYMLIRLVLRQSFEVLKRDGWEESRIKLFLDVLMKEILHPESQSPNGLKFHFIGIYLDELSKVGGRELLADQNLKFIDPFCKIAARTKDQTLVQTIARGVLEVIVDQSPSGPEETLQEQKTQVGESAFSEEEMPENEAAWRKPVSKKPALGKQHSRKDGGHDDGEPEGRLEDAGPLLQFDYKAIADRLLEITNKKNIPPFNRKRLSKLIKKFRDLSEGSVSQLGFVDGVSADEDDQTLNRGRQKRKGNKVLERTELEKEQGNKFSLAEEEESEASVQKRKRKKKKKNHLQPEYPGSGPEAMPPEQNGDGELEASVGRAPKMPGEPGTVATPGPQEQNVEATPVHSRRKRPRKRSPRVQGGSGEPASPLPLEDAAPGGPGSARAQALAPGASPASGAPVPKKKRKLGALPVNGSGPPVLAWPLSPGGRLKNKKGEPSSLDLHSPSGQKAAILKKRKRRKEKPESVLLGGVPESEATLSLALGGGGISSPSKKRPLRPENDFVRFDTPFLPKPLFFRKAKSITAVASVPRAVQRDKTPSSSKKVTFGLNRNMTAEFKKTDKSILVSPTGPSRVAFNPEQRPLHGVLKTPTSSPASTPPGTMKLLPATPKRRPRAMDFF